MDTIINGLMWVVYFVLLYFTVFWLLVFLERQPEAAPSRKHRNPKVTVAIPAYNEEKVIAETVRSAAKLNYPVDKLEIFVVDNASTDKTVRIAKSVAKDFSHVNIKVVTLKEKGKGVALNYALKNATGDYFVIFDADSSIEADALHKLLPHFEGKVACVLPMMKVRNAETFLQKIQWYEYIMNMFYKSLMGRLHCVHVAPGPFSVYRTSVLRELGGFDHPNLTEDLEITLRLQKNHYQIVQTMDATVTTKAPDNLKMLYKQRNRWYKGSIFNALSSKYRGMWFNKDYGDFGLIQMPLIIIPGFLAIFILFVQLFYGIKNNIKAWMHWHSIDYDLITWFSDYAFTFHLLDGHHMRVTVALLMLLIGLSIFVVSHLLTKERVLQYGWFPAVTFLFVFPFFLAICWTGIIVDLCRKRVQDW